MRYAMFATRGVVLALLLLVATAPGWCATWTVPDTGDPNTNGLNLAAVIKSSVQLGDTILLANGATYNGQFFFPNKGAGTGTDADYITIQPIDLSQCPAAGQRVKPSVHAASMPKLSTDGSGAAIYIPPFGHHWRFVCLEITDHVTSGQGGSLIGAATSGSGPSGRPTFAEVTGTHHLIFDRLFVHPSEVTPSNLYPAPATSSVAIGIYFQAYQVTVSNSWVAGFSSHYPQGQSIAVGTDLGRYATISNNEIGALFNALQLGFSELADPTNTATVSNGTSATYTPSSGSATFSNTANLSVGDLVAIQIDQSNCPGFTASPCFAVAQVDAIAGSTVTYHAIGKSPDPNGFVSALLVAPLAGGRAQWKGIMAMDITVQRNRFYKPSSWTSAYPTAVKSYLEVKACVRCLLDANIWEGMVDGNSLLVFDTVVANAAPWSTVRDVTISNNLFKNGFVNTALALFDGYEPATPAVNITITNNLWTHVPALDAGGNRVPGVISPLVSGTNLTITHNTVLNLGTGGIIQHAASTPTWYGQNQGTTNTIFRDNIADFGLVGISSLIPEANWWVYAFPPNGITESNNVITTENAVAGADPAGPGRFPNSFRVPGWDAVGLVSFNNCYNDVDYHACGLATSSPWKGRASDGTDPGVNLTALDAALTGTASSTGTGSSTGTASTLPAPSNLVVR